MLVETRPYPRFTRVATLDREHPAYQAEDQGQPLVITLSEKAKLQGRPEITVLQGEEPLDHTYYITGKAQGVTIVGSDQRRGNPAIIKFDHAIIDTVAAYSDVLVDEIPEIHVIPRSGAQILPHAQPA